MNLAGPIRTAIVAEAAIVGLLGEYESDPSVHTRWPAPEDAGSPWAMISADAVGANEDGLTSLRPIQVRDIGIYGANPTEYRAVEQAAELIHALFHRKRFAISVPGYGVVSLTARAPIRAPTENENLVGRIVTLTARLKVLSA